MGGFSFSHILHSATLLARFVGPICPLCRWGGECFILKQLPEARGRQWYVRTATPARRYRGRSYKAICESHTRLTGFDSLFHKDIYNLQIYDVQFMYDWRLRREWLHFRSMRPIETRTDSPLIGVNGSLYTLSIPCSSLAYPLLKGC